MINNTDPGNGSDPSGVTNATVRDTGDFGAAGRVNKNTNFDLMRATARQVTGNPNLTPTQYGKRTIYQRLK